ncbi:MAG: InlB B-repeat-containing protein [Kiritimatiellaeota bacterium]|nr:InlB B-repeat-containing protein [Kiritimatiellota bacterium]
MKKILLATFGITALLAPAIRADETFVPVTGITGVPTTTTAGTPLTLTGTVEPLDATRQEITWSVADAGTTGATLNDNTLSTTAAGTATLTATVAGGLGEIGIKSISVGGFYTVAVKTDGTLWAWGENDDGELGDGTTDEKHIPTQIGTDDDWAIVTAGYHHTLALKTNGTLWAWGVGGSGQLGDGTETSTNIPTKIGDDNDWATIAAGGFHSVALKTNGTLWAWGYNRLGQVGDGTSDGKNIPTKITGISDVVAIAAGFSHTVALKNDGTVWAWGNNDGGQLGDGTWDMKIIPTEITGLSDVVAIAAGFYHNLALKGDGTIWTWGSNGRGQIGDATWDAKNIPTHISGISDVATIAAGAVHSLALMVDGTLWAWGCYYGLGDGTTGDKNIPTQVDSISNVVFIAGGNNRTLAVKDDSTFWAWGHNYYGELGDGTTDDKLIPTLILEPEPVDYTQEFIITVTEPVLGTVVAVTFDAAGGTIAQTTQDVETGQPYGMLPTPARAGHAFAGWFTEAAGGVQVSADTVVTLDTPHTLYARWVKNPPYLADPKAVAKKPPVANTVYDGFLYDANGGVRGTLAVTAKTASGKWSFTAKAVMQTASLSFTLKNSDKADNVTLAAKTGETLALSLGADVFHGALNGGKAGLALNAAGSRNVFADRKDAAAQTKLDAVRGVYNVALVEGGAGSPLPAGYVTLNVGNLGAVKVAGRMSDGTAFSGAAKLLAGLNAGGWHCVALHRPLYTKKGFVGGLLWINPANKSVWVDTNYGWRVDWVSADPKKGIFARGLDVAGGWFGNGKTGAAVPEGLKFSAGGGQGLPALPNIPGAWVEAAFPLNLPVAVSGAKVSLPKGVAPKKAADGYDYAGVNPSTATLSYTAKTGLFKGSFKIYYDGTDAKATHKAVSVSYTGLMVPVNGTLTGLGAGVATVNKQKIGIPVRLAR